MSQVEVSVPDVGDFDAVEVIELHVAVGDRVEKEDALITLETDKATMDVPSSAAGTIVSIAVEVGSKVAQGDVILVLEAGKGAAADDAAAADGGRKLDESGASDPQVGNDGAASAASRAANESSPPATAGEKTSGLSAKPGGRRLVVLGAGPGGYTAAFRAADLGLEVTLVERWPTLGGVCLNVGCIPSKALLHAARVVAEVEELASHGVEFGPPKIDTAKLRGWKNQVVGQLTQGLGALAKQRKVTVVSGTGRFVSAHALEVEHDGERRTLEFDQCIIAAGSEPVRLPNIPEDPRIMDSTSALELEDLPKRLLVIGGGIIGLEMASVYDALGVAVSVVELTKTLLPGVDRDLARPLHKRLASRYAGIMLGTRVTGVEATAKAIRVSFEGDNAPDGPQEYDRILVAVGRKPNGHAIGADAAGLEVDERGFIRVDRQQRTAVAHVFAIGDIVGQPMLAHKASHEGKVAAEVAAGHKSSFDARAIPSVAFTDPEVAWAGLTEDAAKADGTAFQKAVFPWAASGRSLTLGRADGLTKLLFDPATKRLLGAGIVGTNAGDLISEAVLAIEMGADWDDIGLTIHPHPTLSETIAFAAEAAAGTITDLYIPKR